jgi:magnesium-transporting ATPase (P-type)
VASVLVGGDVADGLVFAIGVTVALVPEGLLPTVTLSLAIGAQHMARRHALVRRLEAVETLGSTSFICTDKTGTLTENRMAVVRAWTPAGEVRVRGEGYAPGAEVEGAPAALDAVRRLAVVAVRCSRGRAVERDGAWVAVGDPMEAALDALGRRVGAPVEVDAAGDPEAARHPFDPRRRRMSVVTGARVLVKGAPGAVLPRCAPAPGAAEAHREMAAAGLRVLAVAARAREGAGDARDPQTAESGLTLLGLVGLEDPPRAHAAAAVAACRAAGIRVAMVTGDHPLTARAIAREVGLLGPEGLVVEGRDLPADDLALGDLVDADGVVVSRVSPEDKLRIARVLRERGHVVAMTGDGVNDGPALRQADIGVAMGRGGSDVAREAADLVLLDDDFATVVAAVEQGRATHRNVRRFLTYHLTDNVAELTPFVVWALSGGRFPLAIGVMQVLALDLVTDSLPAVALGAEPARPGVLKSAPSHGRLLDAPLARRVFGVLGPAEAALGMAAFIAGLLAAGWRPGAAFPAGPALAAASGGAWLAIVAGQAGNALACRSAHITPWRLGWGGNRLLVAAVGVEMTAALLLVLVPPLAALLDQAAPPAAGWVVVLLAAPVMIGVDAAHKALRRRRG